MCESCSTLYSVLIPVCVDVYVTMNDVDDIVPLCGEYFPWTLVLKCGLNYCSIYIYENINNILNCLYNIRICFIST